MAKKHKVKAGECLASIAERYGMLDWRTIYDAPENADFRERRPNPNVIRPGDVLTIPDAPSQGFTVTLSPGETKQVEIAREPTLLRLDVLQFVQGPAIEASYQLDVDLVPEPFTGDVAPDGRVEVEIPPSAQRGRLTLRSRESGEVLAEVELAIGDLDPVTTPRGLRQRLRRLAIDPGPEPEAWEEEGEDDPPTPALEGALRAFQQQVGFEETGTATQETQDKLVELVGA